MSHCPRPLLTLRVPEGQLSPEAVGTAAAPPFPLQLSAVGAADSAAVRSCQLSWKVIEHVTHTLCKLLCLYSATL
jgi:hypothetical protein